MSSPLAFPMYAVNPDDNQAFWLAVKTQLVKQGLAVDHLQPVLPADLLHHWRSPDLLLSQSCGFPLMTQLPDVQVVGAFHYTARGCEGVYYRSWLVARSEEEGKTLADFRGRRVVCNAPDSWSGYKVLLGMIAGLGVETHFFAATLFSGSHRQSLVALREGQADIAAIDCVTWALLQRHEPELLQGLSIIGRSPLAPGLPLITPAGTSDATLLALRGALEEVAHSPTAERVLIRGFSAMAREAWQVLLTRRDAAAGLGVTRLSEKEIECGEGHHADDDRGKQAPGRHPGHRSDEGRHEGETHAGGSKRRFTQQLGGDDRRHDRGGDKAQPLLHHRGEPKT